MLLAMSLQPALEPAPDRGLAAQAIAQRGGCAYIKLDLQTNLSVFDANAPEITEFRGSLDQMSLIVPRQRRRN
jgi:hypothetical protein